MSNIMKIKYGDTAPQNNDLSSYELGFSNNTGTLYIGIPESGEVVPKAVTDLPTGGVSGQVLKYSASGTAVWGTDNDTIYSHPATHPASMITGLPTSLPADGGDADTVNGKTVAVSVPAGAKFTDTVYEHPTNHPPSIITQDASNRFVTDSEKTNWNGKAPGYSYGTADLTAGSSSLTTGKLHFVYE